MKRLIHNVSAFDGNNPTLRKGVNIAIEDDLITEITTGAMEAEKFNQVINGKRMTAIPGWIDCHRVACGQLGSAFCGADRS